jgi:hypothetical protein
MTVVPNLFLLAYPKAERKENTCIRSHYGVRAVKAYLDIFPRNLKQMKIRRTPWYFSRTPRGRVPQVGNHWSMPRKTPLWTFTLFEANRPKRLYHIFSTFVTLLTFWHTFSYFLTTWPTFSHFLNFCHSLSYCMSPYFC